MKRLLLVVLLLALCYPAMALSLNFQNAGDLSSVQCYNSATCTWVESSTGGNNYMKVAASANGYMINKYPAPMTYSSAVLVSTAGGWSGGAQLVRLYDSSHNVIWTDTGQLYDGSFPIKYEVKIIGGAAKVYKNGVLTSSSGLLSVNPSYIGWGYGPSAQTVYWDNFIYGIDYTDTTNQYIVAMPETNDNGAYKFLLKKSLVSAADSGLANANTYVVTSAYNMSTTFSKPNSASETMYLKHTGTGEIVGTETVTGYTGTVVWPLVEDVFTKDTSAAPYGSYVAYLSGSPATISTPIQYVTSGATINFNSALYSKGDQAYYTWNIQNDYWALRSSGYTFSAEAFDVYGQSKGSNAITAQTGTGTYTFSTTDPDGVYYIALVATSSTGTESWVAYDYATLTGYLTFTGYVNDAQTAHRINVANVTIVQSGTVFTAVTVDGNYSTAGTAFGAGLPVIFNITASGHQQCNFTPPTIIATKTVNLMNFTLNATSMTATGISGMGIVRDSTYGRPLAGVTITYTNVSHGTSHTATTNNAGYYLIDATHGGPLVSGYCYLVNSSLTRYTQVAPSAMKCVV